MCMAMFSVSGGHWAVLQVIAWGQMLHSYSRNASLTEALAKTFDGDHPCALCSKVKEGRQRDEKAPTIKAEKKAEVFTASDETILSGPLSRRYGLPNLSNFAFTGRTDAPPRPVPRAFVS